MIDFNKIQFDKDTLNNIQNINPIELLSKMGLSIADSEKLLKGDFSPIQKPLVVDYNVFQKNYGKYFNNNLIIYFFDKAQKNEILSNEELKIYQEAKNAFFKLIFYKCQDCIFFLKEIPESLCLLIQFNNCYFILIKNDEFNIFHFLEKASKINQ